MRARLVAPGLVGLGLCIGAAWFAFGDAVRVGLAVREAAVRDRLGYRLWAAERYADAASVFSDPHWRGLANYRAFQYGRAFGDLAQAEGHLALYNTGVTYARLGLFAQAREMFMAVLAERPDHTQARENAALMDELLASITELASNPSGEGPVAQSGDIAEDDSSPTEGEGSEGDARTDTGEADDGGEPRAASKDGASPQPSATPTADSPGGFDADEVISSSSTAPVGARVADRAWLAQIDSRHGVFLRRIIEREKYRRIQAGETTTEGDDQW